MSYGKSGIARNGHGFEDSGGADSSAHDFETIWLLHRRAVFRRCLTLMRRRDDADEAFSRTGLAAFLRFPAHREAIREILPWLLTLTRNVCLDLHRERMRDLRRHRQEDADFQLDGLADEGRPNPESRSMTRERAKRVEACVARLPPKLRAALELRLYADLADREIAESLEISEVAVRKRLQDARSALRSSLLRHGVAPQPANTGPAPEAARQGSLTAGWCVRTVVVERPGGALGMAELPLPWPLPPASPRRVAALEAYLRRHPAGWRKQFELALTRLATTDLGAAIAALAAVAERRPQALEVGVARVALLAACGRVGEAASAASLAASARPSPARQAFVEGIAAGSPTLLAAAVRGRPGDPGPLLFLARAHHAAGRPAAALAAIESSLLCGGGPAALVLGFDALWAASRQCLALERLEEALAADPGDLGSAAKVAELRLRRAERPPGTDALLRRLAAAGLPQAEECLAWSELLDGRPALARERCARLCREQPRQTRAFLGAGRVLAATGDFAVAVSLFETAIRLDPDVRSAHVELCRALEAGGRPRDARIAAKRALERFPGDWWLVTGLGDVLAESWLIEPLRELVEREEALPAGFFGLARQLERAGELRCAVEALHAGWRRLTPDDGYHDSAPAAIRLARLHIAQHEREEAEGWLRLAADHTEKLREHDVAASNRCALRACSALLALRAPAAGPAGP